MWNKLNDKSKRIEKWIAVNMACVCIYIYALALIVYIAWAMSVLFAHLGVFRDKLRKNKTDTISRSKESASERERGRDGIILVLHLGIKMNCVFTKDMDHCRQQPETLCYELYRESIISCVFLTTVTNCDRKLCACVCECVYHTGYVPCVCF